MSLTRVTITGADDGVDPLDLLALSREFRFVEWGILFSPKRWGTPRYPSTSWVQGLAAVARPASVALSMHVCGGFAREVMAGDDARIKNGFGCAFGRLQINGFVASCASTLAWPPLGVEAILQVRAEGELQEAARVAAAMPRASLLFDPSGGRGIEPFRWPTKPFGARMGYAGGINADNLRDVLVDIGPVDGDFWIDMESGVRTDDRFDLAKVRRVLERAAPYVCAPPCAACKGTGKRVAVAKFLSPGKYHLATAVVDCECTKGGRSARCGSCKSSRPTAWRPRPSPHSSTAASARARSRATRRPRSTRR